MLKILFDQNFNHDILRGLSTRLPGLDGVTTQDLGKERESDIKLLRWASKEKRVIVTHDRRTFPRYNYELLARGETTYGVIVVPGNLGIGKAIEDLAVLIETSPRDEFINRVQHLPLRPLN